MRRTTLNVQTLVHTESPVSLNIQQEGSRPVGTHAQPESSHARISQIPMPPQIHDEAADDDDVIISSAREFEQVSIVFLLNCICNALNVLVVITTKN